jgi:hypothetical protein
MKSTTNKICCFYELYEEELTEASGGVNCTICELFGRKYFPFDYFKGIPILLYR